MARDGITAKFEAPAVAATEPTFGAGCGRAFAGDEPFARIDGAAIAAVTDLYREVLPPGGAILDVMSGWVSHLPPEAPFRRVVGIGTEKQALAENPFLDDWRLQNLNSNPILPFATGEFDGAAICAAIPHLA